MKNSGFIFLILLCCLSICGQTKIYLSAVAPNFDDEYKIYSTVLKKDKGVLVIKDKTDIDADSKNIKKLEQRGFGNIFLKNLEPETMKNFLAENETSKSLEKRFSAEIEYVFTNNDELKKDFDYKHDGDMNWDVFRIKYPKANNIYTLSRIGFSQNRTQSLVFVTNWCGFVCGGGNYYILKKENQEWKIVDKIMTWIS